MAELLLSVVDVWQRPLRDLLRQVDQVARAGNPISRVPDVAAKAELAALCEAVLLLFPTGDLRKSTRFAKLLGNRMGLVSLLNQDLVVTRQVRK